MISRTFKGIWGRRMAMSFCGELLNVLGPPLWADMFGW